MRSVLFLTLGGCPYIWGPPDYGRVGDADGPGRDTSVAPPDTAAPTVSGGPSLREVQFARTFSAVSAQFQVQEGQAPLVGGLAQLSIEGELSNLDVPADLDAWDPLGWSAAHAPRPLPCEGEALRVSFLVQDSAGQASAPVAEELRTTPLGPLRGGVNELGALALPATGCGTVGAAGERAALRFSPSSDGRITLEVYWSDAGADLDVVLFDETTGAELGRAVGPEPSPAVVSAPSDSGRTYRLEIDHWAGTLPDWQVWVHP
jgi:hypothetical protein